MKCILGGRGWVGSTRLGTSWEPQQDLEGRRGFIYTELHLHSSVSSTHAGGRKQSHTRFEKPISFPANQTAGLQLMSAFDCIIISAASHAQEEEEEEKPLLGSRGQRI